MGTRANAGDAASASTVATGADRLAADRFAPLRGKRIGLVTNHTGRVGGMRLIDAMARAPGMTLAAILTPEHGLAGTIEAGAKITSGNDPATGVRVHSLYGAAYKPTPEMLAGLDVLVFDMQDIGTRFYTYISTMGLSMQAAAASGLPFIVLDRPNPLGGEDVSGFVLEKAFASFVGRYPIPVAHGLTIGELARMIAGERLLPGLERLTLDVVEMRGWHRKMRWHQTGIGWVATSPNIPTFESALAYAGTGFFEATVASEGRGTDAPFLMLGHPEIDAAEIVDQLAPTGLPGVRFESVRVTPRARAGIATSPRFRDREIPAVRLSIANIDAYRPLETGISLLAGFANPLARRGGKSLVTDTVAFNRLAGTDRLRAALDRGTPGAEIIASWSAEVAGFRAKRSGYLIYS